MVDDSKTDAGLFPLEKLLWDVSPRDYVESVGKSLDEYTLVGVTYIDESQNAYSYCDYLSRCINNFRSRISASAESVVGVQQHSTQTGVFDRASGRWTSFDRIMLTGVAMVPLRNP